MYIGGKPSSALLQTLSRSRPSSQRSQRPEGTHAVPGRNRPCPGLRLQPRTRVVSKAPPCKGLGDVGWVGPATQQSLSDKNTILLVASMLGLLGAWPDKRRAKYLGFRCSWKAPLYPAFRDAPKTAAALPRAAMHVPAAASGTPAPAQTLQTQKGKAKNKTFRSKLSRKTPDPNPIQFLQTLNPPF